jgi:thiosulfate dehydrogenase (quinone) large subunit
MKEISAKTLAYQLLRIAMGVNFVLHGSVRMPKLAGFRNWMVTQFQQTILPSWSISIVASVLPFVELVIGLLLISGWQAKKAFTAGFILILMLMAGCCLREDWETVGIQWIYLLVYFILLWLYDERKHATVAK